MPHFDAKPRALSRCLHCGGVSTNAFQVEGRTYETSFNNADHTHTHASITGCTLTRDSRNLLKVVSWHIKRPFQRRFGGKQSKTGGGRKKKRTNAKRHSKDSHSTRRKRTTNKQAQRNPCIEANTRLTDWYRNELGAFWRDHSPVVKNEELPCTKKKAKKKGGEDGRAAIGEVNTERRYKRIETRNSEQRSCKTKTGPTPAFVQKCIGNSLADSSAQRSAKRGQEFSIGATKIDLTNHIASLAL